MEIKNKVVMVIGGAGFIGSHLVDELIKEEPKEIIVIDNLFLGKEDNLKEAYKSGIVEFIKFDLAGDYDGVVNKFIYENINIVFNLAVKPLVHSLEVPYVNIWNNINIVNNLCQLQKEGLFKRLIHFSSSEVYGSNMYDEAMKEDHPFGKSTPYAASKAACDLIIQSYGATFGLEYSIIRPFNNYGERQNRGRGYAGVIPQTIDRLLKGEQAIIYGDGKQTRDYIYVKDTVKAAINIVLNDSLGEIINIGSGREICINNVVNYIIILVKKYFNRDIKTDILYKEKRKGDIKRHIANIYKAKDLINFISWVNFYQGLDKTVEWYIDNYQEIK